MRFFITINRLILRRFGSGIDTKKISESDLLENLQKTNVNKKIAELLAKPEIIDYDQPNLFKGNLILCPTPIGNLKDLSFRAYEAITTADLIACEDTRMTGKLLFLIKEKKFDVLLQEVMGTRCENIHQSVGEKEATDDSVFSEFAEKRKSEVQHHPNHLGVRRLKTKLKDYHQELELTEIRKKASAILTKNDSLGFLSKYEEQEQKKLSENQDLSIPFVSEKLEKPNFTHTTDDEYFYDTHSKNRKKMKEVHTKNSLDDEFITFIKRKIYESKLKKGRGLLLSCHRFNEEQRIEDLLKLMKAGLKIVLVPDAGSPCLSDPGQLLINEALKNRIGIESLPGPNSVILALTSSGFPADNFSFHSFWPKNDTDVKHLINKLQNNQCTSVFFENKHRIMNTLLVLERNFGKRQMISISIEMTKLHERMLRGTIQNVYDTLNKNPDYTLPTLKGELTVVLAPYTKHFNLDLVSIEEIEKKSLDDQKKKSVEIEIDKLIRVLHQNVELSSTDLARLLSQMLPMSKSQLYDRVTKLKIAQKIQEDSDLNLSDE